MTVAAPHRTARRPPGGRRIGPRDLVALAFVADAQPVDVAALRYVMDCSAEIVRRRVRAWRDHGLVHVHVVGMHRGNILTLAPTGRELLADRLGREAEALWCPRGLPDEQHLDHHTASVSLHAALLAACTRAKPALQFVAFEHERQIRARLGGGTAAPVQIPDAIVLLEDEQGDRHAVCVEVDHGGHASPRTVAAKVELYLARRTEGVSLLGATSWSVACITSAAPLRRLHRLAVAVADLLGPTDAFVSFALAHELDDRTVLKDAWRHLVHDPDRDVARLVPGSPFRPTGPSRRVDQQHEQADP